MFQVRLEESGHRLFKSEVQREACKHRRRIGGGVVERQKLRHLRRQLAPQQRGVLEDRQVDDVDRVAGGAKQKQRAAFPDDAGPFQHKRARNDHDRRRSVDQRAEGGWLGGGVSEEVGDYEEGRGADGDQQPTGDPGRELRQIDRRTVQEREEPAGGELQRDRLGPAEQRKGQRNPRGDKPGRDKERGKQRQRLRLRAQEEGKAEQGVEIHLENQGPAGGQDRIPVRIAADVGQEQQGERHIIAVDMLDVAGGQAREVKRNHEQRHQPVERRDADDTVGPKLYRCAVVVPRRVEHDEAGDDKEDIDAGPADMEQAIPRVRPEPHQHVPPADSERRESS